MGNVVACATLSDRRLNWQMAMRVEEEARFRLWINPALTAEQRMEVNSAICRILLDPPQLPRRRRAIAVRQQ
jgi:hypothetical protein